MVGAFEKLWWLPTISGTIVLSAIVILLKLTAHLTVFDGCMIFLSTAMFILMMLVFFWLIAGNLVDNVVIKEGRKVVSKYPYLRSLLNLPAEVQDLTNMPDQVKSALKDKLQSLTVSRITQADYDQFASQISRGNGKLLFAGLPGYCMYACFAIAAIFLSLNIWQNIRKGLPAVTGSEAISMSLTLAVFVVELYIFYVIIENIPTPTAMQLIQTFVNLMPGSFAHNLKLLWEKSIEDSSPSYTSLTAEQKAEGTQLAASLEDDKSHNISLQQSILNDFVYPRLSSYDVILLIAVSIAALIVAGLILTKATRIGRIDVLITTLATFSLILVFQVTFICFIIFSLSSKTPFRTISSSPGGPNFMLYKILKSD